MRPIFSGARRAFATAVLVSTIASFPGVVAAVPVNNPPTATSPSLYVGASGILEVETSTLATDPDSDPLTFAAGLATNGTISLNGTQFQFTLMGGATSGSFVYSVFDGQANGTATGTVTVEQDIVDPVFNDLPHGLVLLAGSNGVLNLPDLTGRVSACDADSGLASVTQSPAPGSLLEPGCHNITFTATDLVGNDIEETVKIEVVRSLAVAQASGDSVAGEPEGTRVLRFGVPSINQNGATAYLGRLTAPGVRSTLAVLAGKPVSVRTRVGDNAVGISGATFSTFLDPVLDDAGNVAFIARVSGEGITAENDRGVWVHNGSTLQLIAREGGTVPGAAGAQFKRFSSISLQNGELTFLAELVQGVGGIDKTNDVGVWVWNPVDGLRPFIREGSQVTTSGGLKRVTVFNMLRSARTSRGQGRSHAAPGMYTLWAKFDDGSKGIVTSNYGQGPGSELELVSIAETRTALPTFTVPAVVPKLIGLPATNSSRGFASVMTLASNSTAGVSLDNNQAIFINMMGAVWFPIVREGDEVTAGLSWRGFKDPIINNQFDCAFVGRLAGTGVSLSNDFALAYGRAIGDSPDVIAREGDAVPGVAGAKWSQFISIALPDGENVFPLGSVPNPIPANGPIFLARITSDGSPEGAAITSANDVGLWAIDGNDELRLLLREGDTVDVNGTEKQLKSMTLLNAVSGSRDVSRAFNENGEVILRARFTDNSQAVLTLRMPVQDVPPLNPPQ